MSDFDSELRAQLGRAASQAPTFTRALLECKVSVADDAAGVSDRRGRRPRGWRAAAAVAATIMVAGGTWWATHGDPEPEAASCPSEVVADGQVFVANGDVTRMPRPGPAVDGVRVVARACGAGSRRHRGHPVTAYRIAGVDPSVGFLAGGKVWTTSAARALPGEMRDLYAPVRCTTSGRLAGHLVGSDAHVTEDYHPRAPYTATFVADEGPGLGLETYREVTVAVRVTGATEHGTDPMFVRRALQGAAAWVEVTCDRERFVATAFGIG